MNTMLSIDDDLLKLLNERALREAVPLSQLVNRLIRAGLAGVETETDQTDKPYREKTFSMGAPRCDLTKSLQLADSLADEEYLAKEAELNSRHLAKPSKNLHDTDANRSHLEEFVRVNHFKT